MVDQEILDGFRTESLGICSELKGVVGRLEDWEGDFPGALLEEFAQKIDRIMGAAKTIALEYPKDTRFRQLAALAELAKLIGYKAAERRQNGLVPILAAFLSDVVSTVDGLLADLSDAAKCEAVTRGFAPVLLKRMEWLKTKVLAGQNVPGAGAAQTEIDAIVATLTRT